MITRKEMFEDSLQFHPNAGVKLSKAACGFILPEIDGLVEKYEKESNDAACPPGLRNMIISHLEGLREIQSLIKSGYEAK